MDQGRDRERERGGGRVCGLEQPYDRTALGLSD